MRRAALIAACLAVLATAVGAAHASAGREKLPPKTLRGIAHRLDQYPSPGLATRRERVSAERLLAEMRGAASRWRDPVAAAAAGFDLRLRKRKPGDPRVGILHAEHGDFRNDARRLDPERPETLVYVNVPGRPLVLIGVMFSMPRGEHGPTPGGPITRWHMHSVCARGSERGRTPRRDGSCPPGTARRVGNEMLHVWFTKDLRSAFAIHAPEPELCAAGLLPGFHCRKAAVCKL